MRAALLIGLVLAGSLRADDETRARAVTNQKKAAQEAWTAMDVGTAAHVESKHLLVYAPEGYKARLKAVAATVEKYHDAALKATGAEAGDAYPGKITVYLFPEKQNIPTFARRIEKRRPVSGETVSHSAEDDQLHVAVAPQGGKNAVPVEMLAGERVAALLLQRKAGVRTSLPEWLTSGFGRAVSHRVAGGERFVQEEKKALRAAVRKRNASDVWAGSLEPEEQEAVQGSVVGLLAYGTGTRFAKFLDGFRPGEGQTSPTAAQAMDRAGISEASLNKAWKRWVK